MGCALIQDLPILLSAPHPSLFIYYSLVHKLIAYYVISYQNIFIEWWLYQRKWTWRNLLQSYVLDKCNASLLYSNKMRSTFSFIWNKLVLVCVGLLLSIFSLASYLYCYLQFNQQNVLLMEILVAAARRVWKICHVLILSCELLPYEVSTKLV